MPSPAARTPRRWARSRRSPRGRRPRAAPPAAPARPCSRSACRSRRRSVGRRPGTPPAARRCPRRAAARCALPGFGGSLRASSSSPASACSRGCGTPELDVDARRDRVHAVDRAADLGERRCGCAPSRRSRPRRPCSDSPPHADSSVVAAHRVLELGAVGVHRVARAARRATTGPPSITWSAKTRSAGPCSRIAAAFASTQASSSSRLSPAPADAVALVVVDARTPAAARRRPGGRSPRRRGRSARGADPARRP